MMFVIGATRAGQMKEIRRIIPEHFLLVPGVGSQGGDLRSVAGNGMNDRCGLIVNASRSIIYADVTNKFEVAAREHATRLQNEMELTLRSRRLL
jgi:orotidine-5'-phosphate decarboxylase